MLFKEMINKQEILKIMWRTLKVVGVSASGLHDSCTVSYLNVAKTEIKIGTIIPLAGHYNLK
jgi:hypothetical protein